MLTSGPFKSIICKKAQNYTFNHSLPLSAGYSLLKLSLALTTSCR